MNQFIVLLALISYCSAENSFLQTHETLQEGQEASAKPAEEISENSPETQSNNPAVQSAEEKSKNPDDVPAEKQSKDDETCESRFKACVESTQQAEDCSNDLMLCFEKQFAVYPYKIDESLIDALNAGVNACWNAEKSKKSQCIDHFVGFYKILFESVGKEALDG